MPALNIDIRYYVSFFVVFLLYIKYQVLLVNHII